MKRADTVVFDPDVVADFHINNDFRSISDDNPYQDEIDALRDKIKEAVVNYWRSRGYGVYACPDYEVSSDIAAGRIDSGDIYEPSSEEWEYASDAAWETSGIEREDYLALVDKVREWEDSRTE